MKRREFVKTSALATGALAINVPTYAADKKIKLAILGTGWWGTDFLLNHAMISGHFDIVALCDVDSVNLNRAAKAVTDKGLKKPKLFSNYKEMYDLKGLLAVCIATPTHWHALQFIAACEKGLDVLLEKPVSYDIRESQAMLAAKQKAGNVVLVDFPRAMSDTDNQVKAFIESGEAGKIYQVKSNIHNPDAMLVEKEIPSTLDFDSYCGPAPVVKFMCNENRNNPNWRGIHDLSRGVFADWGIHYIHNIRNNLGLDLPNTISAIGGNTRNFTQDNPDHLNVRFDFDGLPVLWEHMSWGYISPNPERRIGNYYYGDKGTIFEGDIGWEFYPKEGETFVNGPIAFNPGSPENGKKYDKMFQDLFAEFAQGIRTQSNKEITNTFEGGVKTTSCVTLADMAYRTQATLELDATNMDIKNNEKAQQLLKREYRTPYKHPYVTS